METAQIVFRLALPFSSGIEARYRPSKLAPCDLGIGNSTVSFRPRKYSVNLSFGFSDSSHVQSYVSPTRCGVKKDESKETKAEKKRLKLLKRLSKDLPIFSHEVKDEGFGGNLMGEVKGKMITEATEILLAELEHLRSEQKEQQRKKKEEKALRKATLMKTNANGNSGSPVGSLSGSSSESSDSDCGQVVARGALKSNAAKQYVEEEPAQAIQEATSALVIQEVTSAEAGSPSQEAKMEMVLSDGDLHLQNLGEHCCSRTGNERSSSSACGSNSSNGFVAAPSNKIEICMGGKCKKLGAVALMEEFEREVGNEFTVVGCKCMGKCRNGPNVRVPSCSRGIQVDSTESYAIFPTNSLCIGVGLEDVGVIVANLLGKDRNDSCLMMPA